MIIMVDGVRLNFSRSDSRQLDLIDPFNINHIEVISGATSLYGGHRSGGLINIVTKKGQKEKPLELQIGGKTGFSNSKDHDESVAAAIKMLMGAYLSLISATVAGMMGKEKPLTLIIHKLA